jgi:hypothetical protein
MLKIGCGQIQVSTRIEKIFISSWHQHRLKYIIKKISSDFLCRSSSANFNIRLVACSKRQLAAQKFSRLRLFATRGYIEVFYI